MSTEPKKTLAERIAEAELKSNQCLADANEAKERGAKVLAERLYERGQRWHDKWITLTGRGDA